MPDYRAVDDQGHPRYDVQPYSGSKRMGKFGGKKGNPFGKKAPAGKSMSKGGR